MCIRDSTNGVIHGNLGCTVLQLQMNVHVIYRFVDSINANQSAQRENRIGGLYLLLH